MRLADLARQAPFAGPLAVPSWTLGCFSRRCITFATGEEDTTTTVIWVQSHGLTGDIRIPASRVIPDRKDVADCTAEELSHLARGEGFVARTSWRGDHMHWDAFAAFQPYDKWPEPGRLERVGACLIEWAPSGAYVEDWRMQEGSSGLSVGLRLVSETGADGIERPREGGLVIAGDHAILVLDRRSPFAGGRAHELITPDNSEAFFDCVVAYGRDGRTVLAVDPFSQGQPLFADEFERTADNELIQTDGPIRRRWRIDTLLVDQARPLSTAVSEEGLKWLEAERPTLLG